MKKLGILFLGLIFLTGCAMADESPEPMYDISEESSHGVTTKDYSTNDPNVVINDDTVKILENAVTYAADSAISTFSIDVDTAGYSMFRQYISQNRIPPSASIRTEEMVNYFDYAYDGPTGDKPFSIETTFAPCPWNDENELLMIGIQGKEIEYESAPPNNLVFLIDVSGSMSGDKIEMVKASINLLVGNLREEDTVSIVTYAGNAKVVLEPTGGNNKNIISEAVDNVYTGGSTAGAAGIDLAYNLAYETFNFNGNNRVVMFTDGDFNVGATSGEELTQIVRERADAGIYLTILGYGSQYFSADRMEELSNDGDGSYYFIDTMKEADKVLNHEIVSSIVPIADDVKIQIEFNTDVVESYRLIGYENRVLNKEDFDNDEVDAGDLGAGHNVTAFYEITLKENTPEQKDEIAKVALRYKDVGEEESNLIEGIVRYSDYDQNPSSDFLFASAVVEVSLLLRDSDFKGDATFDSALARINANLGDDPFELREEFAELVLELQRIME